MLDVLLNVSRKTLVAGVVAVAVPTVLAHRHFYSTMPSLRDVKAENAKYSPNYLPVAVFVGGTSGVGMS
jgi:hypothetical protein